MPTFSGTKEFTFLKKKKKTGDVAQVVEPLFC
jgi:hypothetical protein